MSLILRRRPPKPYKFSKKLLFFVICKILSYSYYLRETELNITFFIVKSITEISKILRVYGFGGCRLKIRDVCMDLEPCSRVHNLVVIKQNFTKLGQMTST